MSGKKTDNRNMAAKLELRRHFLTKYHSQGEPARVLDCCQGSGLIWSHLCPEFGIAHYWGIDKKPQKGRHRIDSARVLELDGLEENCIDIDTYGAPWEHYFNLCQHVAQPTTAFLTIGLVRMGGGGGIPKSALRKLGLSENLLKVMPASLTSRMSEHVTKSALLSCYDCDIIPLEIAEVESASPNVRYIGVRLEPSKKRVAALTTKQEE